MTVNFKYGTWAHFICSGGYWFITMVGSIPPTRLESRVSPGKSNYNLRLATNAKPVCQYWLTWSDTLCLLTKHSCLVSPSSSTPRTKMWYIQHRHWGREILRGWVLPMGFSSLTLSFWYSKSGYLHQFVFPPLHLYVAHRVATHPAVSLSFILCISFDFVFFGGLYLYRICYLDNKNSAAQSIYFS